MPKKPSYKIVETASDCTIKQFMRCAFENKYDGLVISGKPSQKVLKDAFEFIYAQYVDISGLFLSQEFEILAYIDSLNKRLGTLREYVGLQNGFYSHFGMPYLKGFWIHEKYGYRFTWDPNNPEIFLQKLNQIPVKESKYKIKIAEKTKELLDLRKKKEKKEHVLLEPRKSFIMTLNRLQQQKFVIDKSTTDMETLALMIKDIRDQQEENKMQSSFKKRK